MSWRLGWLVLGGAIIFGVEIPATESAGGRGGCEAQRDLPGVPQGTLPAQKPLTATRLGEHAHDDQLDDLSAAARKAALFDFKQRTFRPGSRSRPTRFRPTAASTSTSSADTSSARALAGP